jgi:hypothetical protein
VTPADYPSLYLAADDAAKRAQALLLKFYLLNAITLVAGAGVALGSSTSRGLAILSAVLFMLSLAVYVYAKHEGFHRRWYQARALSESVKTATWRLVMGAEPFASPDEGTNRNKFAGLLAELLQENKTIGASLAGNSSSGEQITERMLEILRMPFSRKKDVYCRERVEEQRNWYSREAESNRRQITRHHEILFVTYGLAILLILLKIAYPTLQHLPIEVLAVVAASVIGWIEIKRYEELASAYTLTAYEVGIITSRVDRVATPDELADFVGDAENAFSREHTQWAARRSN